MFRSTSVVVALILGATATACADVTVTKVPSNGTSASVTQLVNGKWHVELATTVNDQPTTFTVKGDSDDEIEDILIDADVFAFVNIYVHGATQ
jgi:hypothetical protein